MSLVLSLSSQTPFVVRRKANTGHWEGKLYTEAELEIIDGDHLRVDEQGWE